MLMGLSLGGRNMWGFSQNFVFSIMRMYYFHNMHLLIYHINFIYTHTYIKFINSFSVYDMIS